MKVVITKKELKAYMEVIEEAVKPTMSVAEFCEFKSEIMSQIQEGFKSGAIKVSLNKKLNMVYTIDENYVVKVFSLYARYLAVVVPQVMSIINLSKNLMLDMMDVEMSYHQDDETK